MFRLPVATVLVLWVLSLPGRAQDSDIIPVLQVFQTPKNSFSASLKYSGRLRASFGNLGTVNSVRDIGDVGSEYLRTYDDGSVGIDTRVTDGGSDLFDDGRTNTWNYAYASQVTPDEQGIAFHTYSSISEGATAEADSGMSVGIDLEYARTLGSFGKRDRYREGVFTWGALAGVTLSGVNAETRDTITATLRTVTDTYSLFGATPPAPGYSAPSSSTQTVANPDGTSGSVFVDTTTFLANRPDSRTETTEAGGAQVDGTWQVRGAFYNLRAGPWLRWQPQPRLSVRLSAGGSIAWMGTTLRYNERLVATDFEVIDAISEMGESESKTSFVAGLFGTVDCEWWMSRRTALFASVSYERYSQAQDLAISGRTARVELSSGPAVRFGITTRF